MPKSTASTPAALAPLSPWPPSWVDALVGSSASDRSSTTDFSVEVRTGEHFTHVAVNVPGADALSPDRLHEVVRDARIPLAGVAHQCGTVRFGEDPRTSALDVDCRAHDVDNLYVVDTSFFPSSGAVNPALTAMANALRVGDHLAQRLGAAAAPRLEMGVVA